MDGAWNLVQAKPAAMLLLEGVSADLLAEVERYPTVRALPHHLDVPNDVVIPVRLRHPEGELAFFTTITTFGTPADVTVAALAIETFFPYDERTTAYLRDAVSAR